MVYTHAHADHFGGVRGVTGGGVPTRIRAASRRAVGWS
ncbi:MBL fold metallo-hydrolase [Nonomuraea sp. NPDC004297]